MSKRRRALPKYVYPDTARGKSILRFKRKGFHYTFQYEYGSEGFEKELALCQRGRRPTITENLTRHGTWDALFEYYYKHSSFLILEPSTKITYKSCIKPFKEKYGKRLVAEWKKRHIEQVISKRSDKPAQTNKLLKRLKHVLELAVDLEWITMNPARHVKSLPLKKGGHPTWSETDIQQFEDKHPSGTKARLAFYLFLYTGARKCDCVAFGRQNIKNGKIGFRARKNKRMIWIPVHPALQTELEYVPSGQMQFILTEFGKPFTVNGFGNRIKAWCLDAGLTARSAHGLRKAIARRLAEAGATQKQIAAVLGVTERTASIYTEEADRVILAEDGIAKIGG